MCVVVKELGFEPRVTPVQVVHVTVTLFSVMVARNGFAPLFQGYEPCELLLLQLAIFTMTGIVLTIFRWFSLFVIFMRKPTIVLCTV